MSELGKRSAAKLTHEQRKQRATNAVETRWRNYNVEYTGNNKIKRNGEEIIWKTPEKTPNES